MPRITGILTWLAFSGLALAAPRVALVDVHEIYRKLPSSAELARKVEDERKEIARDPRTDAYRKAYQALAALEAKRKQLGDDPQARQRLEEEIAVQRHETLALNREYQEFRQQTLDGIHRRMIATMEASLDRIRKSAAELGAEKGYDWVIDASGKTNTGLPFVLYSKDADDLTREVTAALDESSAATASQP